MKPPIQVRTSSWAARPPRDLPEGHRQRCRQRQQRSQSAGMMWHFAGMDGLILPDLIHIIPKYNYI